jgi:hypothetical protein
MYQGINRHNSKTATGNTETYWRKKIKHAVARPDPDTNLPKPMMLDLRE